MNKNNDNHLLTTEKKNKNIKPLFQGHKYLKWCRLKDLNLRPSHYECAALPTELNRQNKKIQLYCITFSFD